MLTKLQLETFYRSFLQELCYNLYESPVLITKKIQKNNYLINYN